MNGEWWERYKHEDYIPTSLVLFLLLDKIPKLIFLKVCSRKSKSEEFT